MKYTPIIATLALAALSAQAAVVDTWSFSTNTFNASPQTSDTQSKSMGNWDPSLADTSVPSAGLLRDATGGNSTGAFYGDNLGLTAMPDAVTLTVEIDDINATERDYWFDFLGDIGGPTRAEINAYQGKISLDIEGAGTALKDLAADYGPVFDVAEYSGKISLVASFTWDFANGTLTYTVSGDGEGYTGEGSSAFSDTQTVAADLSAITNIKSMRVRGNTVAAGEYIDLDSVTIATGAAGSTGGGDSVLITETTFDEWSFTSGTPQTSDTLSKSMGNWDPSLDDTSVPSAGLLRDATAGNSTGAFYGDNLGLTEMPDSLTLTVAVADINVTDRDYWFEFLGDVDGNTRLDLDAFESKVSIDVWGAGTELSAPAIVNLADYTGAVSLTVTATWDFANGTLTYTVSGDGVGYSGSGSSAFSDTQTVAADLSAITNIKSMRVRGNTVAAGEYIDLDSVTIATGTAGSTGGGDSSTALDTWTFTDSAVPQTSDTLSKSMGNWDPSLAGTSVPSAGLLRDATGGNSTSAWYGDNLGLTAMPDAVTLTVAVADIKATERDYWFEFLGDVGGPTRAEFNGYQGKVSLDIEGAGTALKDVATDYGPVFDVADYSGAISLEASFTWDFANGTLSYTVSGDGVGYTGEGSSAFSDTQTVAADLSAITNIKSMRVRGGTVAAGEYIDLDSVTLATGTAGSTGGGDGSTGGGDGSTGGGDGSTGGGDGSTGGGDGSTGGGDGSTGGGDGSTGGGDGSTGGVDPNLIPDGSVTLQANGANFDLVLSIEESSDLQTFTQMSLTGSEVTVDASTNTITISIDGSSNKAFYRITGQ